jgi:uncharacterized membrane-anchored protein
MIYSLMPIFLATAQQSQKATGVMNKLLGIAIAVAGGLIALFLIYSIAKDAFAFAKGQGDGSIWKILGKVLFFIFCIVIILVAANWATIGDNAKNIIDPLSNQVIGVINEIGGS